MINVNRRPHGLLSVVGMVNRILKDDMQMGD